MRTRTGMLEGITEYNACCVLGCLWLGNCLARGLMPYLLIVALSSSYLWGTLPYFHHTSTILSSHVARLLCAGPWPLCIINQGNRAPCARFNSMALHSRLTTRQCIVVMYQLYVPHSKHPYYSTMCAFHSRLTTRQCIVVNGDVPAVCAV